MTEAPRSTTTETAPRWGLADAVAATVVAIVAGALLGSAVFALFGYVDPDEAPLMVVAVAQIPLWAGLLGVPLWASRTKGLGSLRADFGLEMRARDVPLGLAAGVAAQIALTAVVPLYRLVGIDPDGVGEAAERLADRADDPAGVIVLILVTVVGASIIEEVCYRGLWLRSFQRRLGTTAAVVATGIVFGAIHFQPLDFLPLALFGSLAAALAARSGRLGPAIWAHAGFNGVAVAGLLLELPV